MDLKALMQPGGRPLGILPYLMALGVAGGSGPLAIALHYRDFEWAALTVAFAVYSPFFVLAAGYALWGLFGRRLSTAAALAVAVVGGVIAAYGFSLYLAEVVLGMGTWPGKSLAYRLAGARGPLLWWGAAAAAWYMLNRAQHHAAEIARAELAAGEDEAASAEARLQALQAQVEPHFLFNTLAHVKWLYRRDAESGRRMLERLVDYLHAALPRLRQADSTLEQELQLTRAYLDIHQLRIGGRLSFAIEVPPEIAGLRFPPLMLLTLVENAIKHGIAPQTDGGTIVIRARSDDRQLRIEVRDTGAGLRKASGTGLGLANVRARLAALFGAGARLVIEPNVPHGVVAAIEIPR